jgi:hypothetical protein
MGQLVNAPECKERPQLKLHRLIRVNDSIPDKQLLLIVNKDSLLLHDHVPHPVCHPRNILYVKVFHILVSLGTVVVTVVLADPGVETLTVANDGSVNGGEEYMPVTSESINGAYKPP